MIIYNDKYTVYVHINKTNNKMYFGITRQKPENRWLNGKGYLYNLHFTNAIYKYGWNGFDHEIIASHLTKDEACNMEKILIKAFNTNNKNYGYNQDEGGGLPPIKVGSDNYFFNKHFCNYDHPMFGKKHTDESKKKMSENHWNASGGNNPNAKNIICIETGKIYPSAIDAQNDTGIKRNNITAACRRDRQLTAGGFHWDYLN